MITVHKVKENNIEFQFDNASDGELFARVCMIHQTSAKGII